MSSRAPGIYRNQPEEHDGMQDYDHLFVTVRLERLSTRSRMEEST
jgi:hypothetical protein